MVRTRVGYAGGKKKNPTYHDLGDHTETIQMDYDPAVISYEELLDVFWDSHNAAVPSWSRQYMSIIFTHDDEQKRLAAESRDREAAKTKSTIVTEIRPAGEFFLAEDYHQKYLLRSERDILREFTAIYPSETGFCQFHGGGPRQRIPRRLRHPRRPAGRTAGIGIVAPSRRAADEHREQGREERDAGFDPLSEASGLACVMKLCRHPKGNRDRRRWYWPGWFGPCQPWCIDVMEALRDVFVMILWYLQQEMEKTSGDVDAEADIDYRRQCGSRPASRLEPPRSVL